MPHVTWCPTGSLAFLPLHAAGVYRNPHGPKVFDFVASSYVPSLSALFHASSAHRDLHAPDSPAVLCVTQTNVPKHRAVSSLPGTIEEARVLRNHFKTFTQIDGTTAAEIIASIPAHPWLHLACHGTQDIDNPTNSAFVLDSEDLTLLALISAPNAHAELAFLSACETAMGDARLPDEAVHLAAGMLAVGYRGVVGTMWSIADADAPVIADAFYGSILEDRRRAGVGGVHTGAAYALHEAVRKLREEIGEDSFARWVPFVHFGV
jgi:CHAT domain-containing protein